MLAGSIPAIFQIVTSVLTRKKKMKTVSELTEKLQGYYRDLEVLVVDTKGNHCSIGSLTADGVNLLIGLSSEVTEDADSEDSDSKDDEE